MFAQPALTNTRRPMVHVRADAKALSNKDVPKHKTPRTGRFVEKHGLMRLASNS